MQYTNVRYGRVSQRFDHAELAVPGLSVPGEVDTSARSCARAPFTPFPAHPLPGSSDSEDCLFLNVWSPVNENDDALKPVVVVLVGGNFVSGGSGDYEFFNASVMASLWNQVVVVPSYRVGLFGFMNLQSSERASQNNAGFSDQSLVLQWVQKNVELYGGSSNQVTLLGHEAGATAVGYHLLSTESTKLIQRAILISGSPYRILPRNGPKKIHDISRDLLCGDVHTGSDQGIVHCLRSKSVQSLIVNERTATLNGAVATFSPVFLGANLTQRFHSLTSASTVIFKNRVQIIVGTTEDEGTAYTTALLDHFGMDSDQHVDVEKASEILRRFLMHHEVDSYEDIVSLYFKDKERIPVAALVKAVGDFVVHCPVDRFVKEFAKSGNDVYVYNFRYMPQYRWWPRWMGVPQMLDWLYISGNVRTLKYASIGEDDALLSERMSALLSCFALTG